MLFILQKENSIANQFLSELRDQNIQQDRLRFNTNMERLGSIMAYELSKQLAYQSKDIDTPLQKTTLSVLKEQPVLLTVLRAGISYLSGFQHFFDQADCGFIGAYRQEGQGSPAINLEYVAIPAVAGRDVILIDPMLATGSSILKAIEVILQRGIPRQLFIACVVAAPEGLDYLKKNITLPHSIWCAAVDEKLNHQWYIMPGLGDAGDLSFGKKNN